MPGPVKRLLEEPVSFVYEDLTAEQKEAVDCYEKGLALWNEDIGHDLKSEQAAKNLEAMKLWYRAADLGYIRAMATIIGSIEDGGFVKDAETNKEVPYYGKCMGLNIDGKSGWQILREFGQKAIDAGLDDPQSFGNSRMAKEIIYTSLAECYGDDECLGVEPWAADYEKCLDYYLRVADLNFKTYRYVAELFWFGHLSPPEGKSVGEISLEYMLKAVQSKDATANYYLGLWYLNDGGKDPVLPVPEGETKYTMAVKYLEAGREIANHGTIRKTYEALSRLADIYESGEGAPSVPKDLEKALEIYNEALGEKYYPGNPDFTSGKERVQAQMAAGKEGLSVITYDKAAIKTSFAPVVKEGEILVYAKDLEVFGADISFDEAEDIISITNMNYTITAEIGCPHPVVNNTAFSVPVPPELINGKPFISAKFVCGALGFDVEWDEKNRILAVTTADGHHPGEGSIVAADGNTIEFAGKEWLILEEKNDRRLIIAADVLFERAYNEKLKQVTWEKCDIRRFLNSDFLETFSEEDRKNILKTSIANPYNDYFKTLAGNPTEDRIFLLSQEEEDAYFGGNSKTSSAWWTRTPGIDQRFQVMVAPTGEKNNYGWRNFTQLGGVRPAMWIVKEEPDPHSHPQMVVSTKGEDTLVVSFDRPMHPEAASFAIKKGEDTDCGITAVKWSEDHHDIFITLNEKLSAGEYNVFMENVRNQRKNRGSVTV